MPLDKVAQQYADQLFTKKMGELARDHGQRISTINADFAKRGLVSSGPRMQALVAAGIEHAGEVAQARVDSLLMAYEKAGSPFDQQAVEGIINDVAQICEVRKGSLLQEMALTIRRTNLAVPALAGALQRQIDQGFSSVVARVRLDLTIKLSEAALGAREVARAASSAQSDNTTARSVDADWKFAKMAVELARKSMPEDQRTHPKVGVVVVKDGKVVSTAYRGETEGCHAEYIASEKKVAEEQIAGATVYTTLEPCTSRNHPKIPCATRLRERKVGRVVIGMLDPNPEISGRGVRALREANIAIDLFPDELKAEVEEMNREFLRAYAPLGATGTSAQALQDRTSNCDPKTDPLVVLEYDCSEGRPLRQARSVRDCGFKLWNRGGGDALDVHIEEIALTRSRGIARFERAPKLFKGEKTTLLAAVPGRGALMSHDFELCLMDEWNARGTMDGLGPIAVKVRYRDYFGTQYVTEHLIEYDVFNGTAVTRYVGCHKDR